MYLYNMFVLLCTYSYRQHNHIVTLALILLMYSLLVKQYIFMTHGKLSCLGRILTSFTLIESHSVFSIALFTILFSNGCLSMKTMVLIIDGNLEIGAHVRSDFDCLTSLRHLFTSRAVQIYFLCLFSYHMYHDENLFDTQS